MTGTTRSGIGRAERVAVLSRMTNVGGGHLESKPRDLGGDRGYRVANGLGVGGVGSKPVPSKC